jgi:hypothetical protein
MGPMRLMGPMGRPPRPFASIPLSLDNRDFLAMFLGLAQEGWLSG